MIKCVTVHDLRTVAYLLQDDYIPYPVIEEVSDSLHKPIKECGDYSFSLLLYLKS